MKNRLYPLTAILFALGAFLLLILYPQWAAEGAKARLSVCGGIILPSLFPFMVLGNLMSEIGLPSAVGRFLSPLTRRFFGVSGVGASAFFMGITGGYPLGAITVARLYTSGQIGRTEASRLLRFCDNTGPAFIVSVAGSLIFKSTAAGFFLYGIHVFSALLAGLIQRGPAAPHTLTPAPCKSSDFFTAFTESVKSAAFTCVSVCGFVVFFSALTGLLDSVGILSSLAGKMSHGLGTELHFSRSLLIGLLELGSGMGSLQGLSLNSANLALCAFILGWGGISVRCQAASAIKESGLPVAANLFGKLFHGLLSALLCVLFYPLFF